MKELRGERTLYDIDKQSGIERGQLHRYEAGRIPEDALVEKIANFYGVPYYDLKALCFEDLYPEGSRERATLFQWLKSKMPPEH